ncbi:MAG: response regulator transcription factor [Anaerolineae bacterium]|nr:response regulator transcription factor [Anaerolineae bacterium]
MTTILMIDDDPLITGPVARALTTGGYRVTIAENGEQGAQMTLQGGYDLVILDIMLPGIDGWEVCRRIRAHSVVPILMLTALGEEVDRILGLELGADDYLTKPFSARELQAHIRALLRRVAFDTAPAPAEHAMRTGSLSLDLVTRRVYKGNAELSLRYKEFELLSLLMKHNGEVVTRAQLFDEVWGTDWLGDTRTLDVHIRWLREKIEDDPGAPRYIQTVRGVGYRFTPIEGKMK